MILEQSFNVVHFNKPCTCAECWGFGNEVPAITLLPAWKGKQTHTHTRARTCVCMMEKTRVETDLLGKEAQRRERQDCCLEDQESH